MGDKDIAEIKQSLGKIWDSINEFRVLVAGQYITKDDLEKFIKANEAEHKEIKESSKGQVPAWLVFVLPILTGLVVWGFTK